MRCFAQQEQRTFDLIKTSLANCLRSSILLLEQHLHRQVQLNTGRFAYVTRYMHPSQASEVETERIRTGDLISDRFITA